MEYHKGDLVRVKTFKTRPVYWNKNGSMDHLMGKVIRIKEIASNNEGFYVKDAYNLWDRYLKFDDVEPIENYVEIYQTENKVIARNKTTGKQAVAKCNTKEDTFNFVTGAKLALERLTEIKVGSIVKITNAELIRTTDKKLVKSLAGGNKDILLRWSYNYPPFWEESRQVEGTFRVIAKNKLGDCLIERRDIEGMVLAINVNGLKDLIG